MRSFFTSIFALISVVLLLASINTATAYMPETGQTILRSIFKEWSNNSSKGETNDR